VAVLDTGVDGDHPALEGRIVADVDCTGSNPPPGGRHGHGTAVAGAVAALALQVH